MKLIFLGEVSWDQTVGTGATFDIDDPTITHQVNQIVPDDGNINDFLTL
jgi:hypothetical protein